MGILRSGHTMFLISPRNAPAAVVDMLRKTNCRHVLVSQDTLIQELVQPVKKELHDVELHAMPTFEDIYPGDAVEGDEEPDDLPKSYGLTNVAMILHSSGMDPCFVSPPLLTLPSGSTNHPKPIRWTHRRMIHWSAAPCELFMELYGLTLTIDDIPGHGEVDLTLSVMSIHGTPMFHGIGMIMLCFAVGYSMSARIGRLTSA